jgi:hypothetical protein
LPSILHYLLQEQLPVAVGQIFFLFLNDQNPSVILMNLKQHYAVQGTAVIG